MRDPDRIESILAIIKFYWEQNPDLRLMQLLFNAAKLQNPNRNDFFYLEDDMLIEALADMETKIEELDRLHDS